MMKKNSGKKLALALAIGAVMTVSSLYASPVMAANMSAAPVANAAPAMTAVTAAEIVESATGGVAAWEEGKIYAEGRAPVAPQGMAMAIRAARIDAQRNLIETIKGVQITSDTTMEGFLITNDTVKSHVEGVIQGAQVVGQRVTADGECVVTMSVPMYGVSSVASAVLPEYAKTIERQDFAPVTPNYAPPKETQTLAYTGVVIDASGMGLEGTFSPVIYDTNGRIVYGAQNIDYTAAINNGMVGYSRDLLSATGGSSRAGTNPLVLKAVEVRGGQNSSNPVNVVVSVEDADKILYANTKSGFLSKCAVVFVR